MDVLAKADEQLTRDAAECRRLLGVTSDLLKQLPVVQSRAEKAECSIGDSGIVVTVALCDAERLARVMEDFDPRDNCGQRERCCATLALSATSITCQTQRWEPHVLYGIYMKATDVFTHSDVSALEALLNTYYAAA
jgi:hypothetical protein